MHRAVLALITTLFVVPVAFTQSIEVASCTDCKTQSLVKKKQSASRMLIKARCAFPDGTLVTEKLIEIDSSLSAEEKRATAEAACAPIMEEASARCDDLADRVEEMRREWRIAAPKSYREHELKVAMKKAFEAAPAYCK